MPVDAGTAYAASDNALTLYFKPDPNADGTTTFQYTANDGELDSAQAMATIEVEPAFDPLLISNFIITGSTRTSVTVSWETDDPSTSQVQVTNVMNGEIILSAADPTLATSHTLTLTGLRGNTFYLAQGISEVPGGDSATSVEAAFLTPR